MLGETCLPSYAYFSLTPDYTPFILGLNISNFVVVYIDYDFPKYDFGMLTSASLNNEIPSIDYNHGTEPSLGT